MSVSLLVNNEELRSSLIFFLYFLTLTDDTQFTLTVICHSETARTVSYGSRRTHLVDHILKMIRLLPKIYLQMQRTTLLIGEAQLT